LSGGTVRRSMYAVREWERDRCLKRNRSAEAYAIGGFAKVQDLVQKRDAIASRVTYFFLDFLAAFFFFAGMGDHPLLATALFDI